MVLGRRLVDWGLAALLFDCARFTATAGFFAAGARAPDFLRLGFISTGSFRHCDRPVRGPYRRGSTGLEQRSGQRVTGVSLGLR
jgi:hypothetical protein